MGGDQFQGAVDPRNTALLPVVVAGPIDGIQDFLGGGQTDRQGTVQTMITAKS